MEKESYTLKEGNMDSLIEEQNELKLKIEREAPKVPIVEENKAEAQDKRKKVISYEDTPNDCIASKISETADTLKFEFRKSSTSTSIPPYLFRATKHPKINIVTDINFTLLQAVPIGKLAYNYLGQDTRVKLFKYEGNQMAVVLRPHFQHFLQVVSEFADLFICTTNKKLAESLLYQFIDPNNTFIHSNRIYEVKEKALCKLFVDPDQTVIFDSQPWDNIDQSKS